MAYQQPPPPPCLLPPPTTVQLPPTLSLQPSSSGKLWGGRFTGKTDPIFEQYNASISFDKQLWEADIAGSRAYAAALARAGTITTGEADTLADRVWIEWLTSGDRARFQIQASDEDIHTANERRLGDFVGSVAGKLHTGRSRNDQVATDIRLYLRTQILHIKQLLRELILVTAAQAEQHVSRHDARLHSSAACTAHPLLSLPPFLRRSLAARRTAAARLSEAHSRTTAGQWRSGWQPVRSGSVLHWLPSWASRAA